MSAGRMHAGEAEIAAAVTQSSNAARQSSRCAPT
ncbi:MAG: hypothetical protein QOE87_2216 [Gaiellales bacterium]|nr:hypothetical protein [Gaiellales bacterium]